MSRLLAWGIVVLLGFGCETGEEPIRGANPGTAPRLHEAPPKRPREPVQAPRPGPAFDLPSLDQEVVEDEERDLAAELSSAIGVPIDCVQDFVATQPTTIRVSITATVRPTGMIITPSAYGSGLSTAARDCIERRAANTVLRPLEEAVSEVVSTIIEIDFSPAVIVEADPGVPEPRLKNVREPLPKRPEVAPSGTPIQAPTSKPISGGFEGGRPIQAPTSKKVTGPKPRPIDGYDLDQNAQEWR